ncbi:hypothetical protein ANN_23453 [Periplaneta americana]|uniref:Uncharacterized protein n=1 Tax=Periplaneta americana TaxID=6978 RepID=A0ABQ8SMF9_PERAM|nr:hypothetical protein ANN_23453 [Periplaneta americana]
MLYPLSHTGYHPGVGQNRLILSSNSWVPSNGPPLHYVVDVYERRTEVHTCAEGTRLRKKSPQYVFPNSSHSCHYRCYRTYRISITLIIVLFSSIYHHYNIVTLFFYRIIIFVIVPSFSPSHHHSHHRVITLTIVSSFSSSCHHSRYRVIILVIVSSSFSPSCYHSRHRVVIIPLSSLSFIVVLDIVIVLIFIFGFTFMHVITFVILALIHPYCTVAVEQDGDADLISKRAATVMRYKKEYGYDISITGLMFGARGTISDFSSQFCKTLGLHKSFLNEQALLIIRESVKRLRNHLYGL